LTQGLAAQAKMEKGFLVLAFSPRIVYAMSLFVGMRFNKN